MKPYPIKTISQTNNPNSKDNTKILTLELLVDKPMAVFLIEAFEYYIDYLRSLGYNERFKLIRKNLKRVKKANKLLEYGFKLKDKYNHQLLFCKYCGEEISSEKQISPQQKYHKKCARMVSGGIILAAIFIPICLIILFKLIFG